jgi:hypothetical protein
MSAWAVAQLGGCFYDTELTCENARVGCPSGGEGGSGGGGNPACNADPTQDPAAVIDDCGVFVSTSAAPGGDGTREKPYAVLQEAIDNAGGKRVYACTSGAFAESVILGAGIEVIGGFDCDAEWTWSAEARSTIEGPAGAVALMLTEAANGAKVQSFAIRAASATVTGGSSIAVAVADVEAELAQVDVTAGDGIDGDNGRDANRGADAGSERAGRGKDGRANGRMRGAGRCGRWTGRCDHLRRRRNARRRRGARRDYRDRQRQWAGGAGRAAAAEPEPE